MERSGWAFGSGEATGHNRGYRYFLSTKIVRQWNNFTCPHRHPAAFMLNLSLIHI